MRKMNQRLGRNVRDPSRGVPFGPCILADELPNNFRASNMSEYDGISDPMEHLCKFENCALLHQYPVGQKVPEDTFELIRPAPGGQRDLRGYIQRFKAAALKIPSATADMLSNAFTQGLNDGKFFRSLAKKSATSFDSLLARIEKYVNMEEATMMKGAGAGIASKEEKGVRPALRRPPAEGNF
ncbi:hypothetical protein BUALT_Bualt06G0048800 [Buddleja alternifolia]|uniref:Retrotransposon gag domain-containing protein n=1 Tax=Buddleja alternifolia TaxID=168488 RepID=A0AAV6XNP9_9LAMI|nr:hypothetical protein BUALT_Bualt06G0048800 [Buddleja alternifolia]